MKGGESFGINNTSFGNIIIALNIFKYYIKVEYKDVNDTLKNGVYYFIFSLNENNNLVTSFGLTNELIVNGNLDIRNSKTFLDLGVKDSLYNLLLNGSAYKEVSGRRSDQDIDYEIESGIPSTLQIELAQNEIPKYILTLNPVVPKEKFTGTANTLGEVAGPDQDINSLIETQKQLLNQYNQDKTDINKDNIIENEKLLFLSINRSIKSLDPAKLEELYTFLIDSNNFILEGELIQSYNGVLTIVSKKIPKEDKDRLTPKPKPKPTPQPKPKPVENLNKGSVLADKLTRQLKEILLEMLNKKVNPENDQTITNSIKNAYVKLFEYLKSKEYISANNDISTSGKSFLLLWRKFIININKEGKLNADFLSDYINLDNIFNSINAVLKKHPEINSLEQMESEWPNIFQEINDDFKVRNEETPQANNKVGGGVANSKVILVNNNNDLNVSEFEEPIIYLTSKTPDKIVSFSQINSKDGKIPVFGYLTVGKQLMLKMLELQTNPRVSFKPEDSTSQKFKNLAKANPLIVMGVATYLFNGIVNFGIDRLGMNFYTVKEMVKGVCTYLFGPIAGFILATSATWFLPDPKRIPVGNSPATEKFWSNAKETAQQMSNMFPTPNSTSNLNQPGGYRKKSRKNIKTKRTKKRTSRKARISRRRN